ncbi:hypothetical protein MOBT1_000128 [Malassezia obtusa]|uniref:CRAL-TRIO domain-containing protein n=1 Tax=Malassezia obtusa TaxID=76774 RepID=A0AAF0DX13_9BASI|nr:hypothetical protein MOBT1_000128 [Malassezia obtusa]
MSNKPRKSMPNIFNNNARSSQNLTVPGSAGDTNPAGSRLPRRNSAPSTFVRVFLTQTPASGHPGNLTEEQKRAYEELEKALVNAKLISLDNAPPYQNVQLLRFLRARNFDVNAARDMYVNAEKWKESINLERLCCEFEFEERDIVAKHGWRMYFHKTDRLGRPIFIQDLSNLDPDKVFKYTSPDRIVRNFAVTLEKAVRHSILDDNFPELSGRVQIINAPYLFTTVWSYVKAWLPAHTAEKIDICGSDYLPRISNFVDMSAWPKHLGGQCECSMK